MLVMRERYIKINIIFFGWNKWIKGDIIIEFIKIEEEKDMIGKIKSFVLDMRYLRFLKGSLIKDGID